MRPPLTSKPQGTLFRASQFLAEELPIRLAHRVKELDDLPDGLNEMPSVNKVKDWYAQSFEVCSPFVRSPTALGNPKLTERDTRKLPLFPDPTSATTSRAA
jgi:pyruvate dehydrogenase kinase 2/3/4